MTEEWRPTRDETAMAVATVFAARSTCSRAHVGAVITVANRVVATGYNGAPAGMPHCNHTCTCGRGVDDLGSAHGDDCPASSPCRTAVHAEANAVAFAARHGARVQGGFLYTTMCPCLACAQLIVNAGLVGVVAARPYRDRSGLDLLTRAGLEVAVLVREPDSI